MQTLKYYRKKNQLTTRELAEAVGVKIHVVVNYESGMVAPDDWEVKYALIFADYFGVTIEEICSFKDDDDVMAGEHAPIRGAPGGVHNCLAGYRRAKNLTLGELAKLIGVGSREAARKACRREYARDKHVRTLAKLENMTVDAFEEMYMPKSTDEAVEDFESACA